MVIGNLSPPVFNELIKKIRKLTRVNKIRGMGDTVEYLEYYIKKLLAESDLTENDVNIFTEYLNEMEGQDERFRVLFWRCYIMFRKHIIEPDMHYKN